MFPRSVASLLGIEPDIASDDLIGLGEPVECKAGMLDLQIVDASYPQVACFEFVDARVSFPVREDVLAYPVVGWDILRRFNIELDSANGRIGLRFIVDHGGGR